MVEKLKLWRSITRETVKGSGYPDQLRQSAAGGSDIGFSKAPMQLQFAAKLRTLRQL